MTDKPAVLFVCVHNAGRSQMAAGCGRRENRCWKAANNSDRDPIRRRPMPCRLRGRRRAPQDEAMQPL